MFTLRKPALKTTHTKEQGIFLLQITIALQRKFIVINEKQCIHKKQFAVFPEASK